MLYYLFDYLFKVLNLRGSAAFTYVSTRAGMALVLSLIIATLIGNQIIRLLRKKQIGETIRDLNLEGQNSKKGTPTMGGIIIIISLIVPVLLFTNLSNIYIIIMLVSTLGLGILGGADDYIKVFRKNKNGLRGKYKIIAQICLGVFVAVTVLNSPAVRVKENTQVLSPEGKKEVVYSDIEMKSTKTTIPLFTNNNLDYGDIAKSIGLGANKETFTFLFLIIFYVFVITAVSNGANLTDGLDGLAAGTSSIIGSVLGILAYMSSHIEYARYLNIMYIPGTEELVVFAAAFMGATIGFLWYNSSPAQVFMGDTGSLTLGGIIAVFAILIRKELLLPILCGIFLVESLSVIAQVLYFKYTKKRTGEGKRIFKMTPLHHHFQRPGSPDDHSALIQRPYKVVPETKIVVRMWLIGILLAVITIISLKFK